MLKRQFAITKCVGNHEQLLKAFEDKQAAIAFGNTVAATNTQGVISCISALISDSGQLINQDVRVYRVWPP